MNIEYMTMEEYKNALNKTRTLIIPYGSVEEHGKHLPLSTDTIIPLEILKTIQMKRPVFVAPPIHYGVCTSTKLHSGTISISPETLRSLTRDIIKDSHKKGILNFILVSGHAGGLHMNALKEVAELIVDEIDDIKIAIVSPYELLWRELSEIAETKNDSHAGEIETSLMLALRPDLVNGTSDEEYPTFPKPLVVRNKLKYWPGGVWGNPQKASKETGKKVIELIIKKMIDIIDKIESEG